MTLKEIRIEKGDLTFLAKEWELIVESVEYPTKAFALRAIHGVVFAFLRGRGMRMGSAAGFQKHGWNFAALMTKVVDRIVSDDARAIWFPTLARIGLDSHEGAADWIVDAMQAEGTR